MVLLPPEELPILLKLAQGKKRPIQLTDRDRQAARPAS